MKSLPDDDEDDEDENFAGMIVFPMLVKRGNLEGEQYDKPDVNRNAVVSTYSKQKRRVGSDSANVAIPTSSVAVDANMA